MFPDWGGRTVAVIGSGPSAAFLAPHVFGRFPVLGVNRAYELGPVDALYAADGAFWTVHPAARALPVPRYCACETICGAVTALTRVRVLTRGLHVHRMQRGPLGTLGHGGNSGFQAVNLAAQCGASRLLLVGLDYQGEHWHGPHRGSLWNPKVDSLLKWRDHLDNAAETLHSWGIEVVNLSKTSALRKYRYVAPNSKTLQLWASHEARTDHHQ